MEALAKKPGYKEHIKQLIIDRTQNNDVAQQLAALRNLIAQKVDLIIFDPASEAGLQPVLDEAKAAGIPMISAVQAVSSPDAYNIATNYTQAAVMAAHWLIKQMHGPSKNIALLEGIAGAPATDGAYKAIQPILKAAGVKVVARASHGWDESKAQKVMASILQSNPHINGVLSLVTGGHGVPEAFKQANLPFVPITGGSSYNTEPCTQVKYASQGLNEYLPIGYVSIEAHALQQGLKLLEGQQIPKNEVVPPLVITKANAAKYCHKNLPPLFSISYTWPGLPVSLSDILKIYHPTG
jgi:ribose transport system substrate-binding protein